MPKRKHNNDYDYISDQIKKLKKKLKRARKQNVISSSESDTESKNSQEDNGLLEEPIIELETNENVSQSEQNLPEVTNTAPNLLNTDISSVYDLTSHNQTSSDSVSKECESTELDKDILEVLGDDPSSTVQYGEEIHKELANRLQHITVTGLNKEARKDLQQKYLLPANAVLLGAPTLNPEIKAALPETLATRDKAIESKQKLLASAISCVASATSYLLEPQNQNKVLLMKLMDANRLLCDIQHSDSVTRRMFSTSVLKKDVKSQILNSKIDKFLFSENLPETLKTAKAVSKSSAEIKYNNTRKDAKKPQQPSTSKAGNLNSKTQVAPHQRPPVTARKNQHPVSHQNRPAGPSRTSSQRQKTTNYRR